MKAIQLLHSGATFGLHVSSDMLLIERGELWDARLSLHFSSCLLFIRHALSQTFELAFDSLILLANVVIALSKVRSLFFKQVETCFLDINQFFKF